MAFYRQLLVFTVPSVAVLFGIYWYRRKRGCANSDPGGNTRRIKTLKQELEDAIATEAKRSPAECVSPGKSIAKSAPIDIIPNGINSQRSSPLQLTDKQLDLEIEKARSQKLYDMEIPIKKCSKENTPPSGEMRGKSLPAEASSPAKRSPSDKASKSLCGKQGSPISCLAEQILKSKLKEESESQVRLVSNTSTPLIHNPPAPIAEEIVFEEVAKVSAAPVECNVTKSISPDKSTKSSKKHRKSKEAKTEQNKNTLPESTSTAEQVDSVPVECASNEEEQQKGEESCAASEAVVVETNSVDRDSANHSPADTMLASPSISNFSDNHSEGSNDSGKGCSESPSPPPTNVEDSSPPVGYIRHQFVVPQSVVGMIIGTRRNFLNKMNETTCAKVHIRTHPETTKLKICSIEGSQQDIDIVLDMIRQKLPEKRFPNISLKDISAELCASEFSLMYDCYHLNLVEGVNNDSIVSCYVSPAQLFLQQPTHPTYPSLHILHTLMGVCYQDPKVPSLPAVVSEGMICAAPTANNWYRTQVITTNAEQNTSLVKLVDFGGFMNVNNSLLKQIRSDFMMLPFQATEVQLAHIAPIDGGEWSPEAVQVMAGLTSGQLLQAQVIGYNETGLPQVYLYLTLGPQQVISLNQELVVRGLAEWLDQES